MKGAFGGGFSIVGIPLLSFVMDPVTAGGLLAPLFIAMDLFALRYWQPSTWSRPDLRLLLPGLVIGIGAGSLLFPPGHRDRHGCDHLIFVGLWLLAGAQVRIRPRSTAKAIAAGLTSGITTMVAHSGGPTLAMYLLPLGLSKEIYAGTTSLFFTVGNATKAVPWLLIVRPTAEVWIDGRLLVRYSHRSLAWLAPSRPPRPASDLSCLLRIARSDRVEVVIGWSFRLSRVSLYYELGLSSTQNLKALVYWPSILPNGEAAAANWYAVRFRAAYYRLRDRLRQLSGRGDPASYSAVDASPRRAASS
jgi:uncharacterized protein